MINQNSELLDNDDLNNHKLERELIKLLLDNTREATSLRSFSEVALMLMQSHPSLMITIGAFWCYESGLITIIAVDDLNFDVQKELQEGIRPEEPWQTLKISYVPLKDHMNKDLVIRVDICLEMVDDSLFYFSFWSPSSEQYFKNLIPFIKDFLAIFNLFLLNILNKENLKLVKINELVTHLSQLKMSETRYRNLMNAVADGIFIHDLKGRIVETNSAARRSLGYSREELNQFYVWDFEIGPNRKMLNQMWKKLRHEPIVVEGRHRRKNGTTFPVDVRLGIFEGTGEQLVLAIVRDISAQKQSEDIIRKLTRAMEQSPILVLITDKMGTIEYVNAKAIEQTGYCSAEILGQNTRLLQSGQTPVDTYKLMWKTLQQGNEWRGELLNKNKHGDLFWVSAIISPLRNDEDEITHYLGVMEDISQKKSYEEMLKYHATYDNLTNLPNRVYGYNKLERAIAKASNTKKKLAVLFLDLDEFKHINDSLGHAAGDLVLKAFADRYLSIIRQTDTIARLGGDEFMMILEDLAHFEDAEHIARKCHEACLKPIKIESHSILISASIGIAVYPDHGKDAKNLMRNADIAMYQSKMHNKNNWTVFVKSMGENASNRIRIKAELQQVLNRDELYLCYQPIIDIKNDKVVAAEALLRWDSRILGHLLPNQIIPIAEETGLIIQIGYWIIKRVCSQINSWQSKTDKKIIIAVNISTVQLKQKDFVIKVKGILNKANVAPDSLIFEITESVFIDDSKFILSQLEQLNKMNIHCSLDDFGTGYSSLISLRSYPFKSIKIDKVFIQGININNNDLSLVHSIITMCKNLKLNVVAEGIETVEQLELLRSIKCDMVQGWYFSEALTSEEYFLYLNK